jgi:hypothetical protein
MAGMGERKMDALSGKSKSRRSMRVATIFTGVAAVTVGVTQAANAQDVAHPAAKPTAEHAGRAMRPDGRVDGSIEYYGSCAGDGVDPHWLHISTAGLPFFGRNIIGSACFGFAGIYSSPPGTGIYGECGGGNYGYIDGENRGKIVSLAFGPATTYRHFTWSHYDDVLISKWKGNDTCTFATYYGKAVSGI